MSERAKKLIVGIDPGIGGAVAFLRADGEGLVDAVRAPTSKSGRRTVPDVHGMVELLRARRPGYKIATVAIEDVHAMPRDGAVSAHHFGRAVGLWEGMVSALRIPLVYYAPQVWMRRVGIKSIRDESRSARKRRIVDHARALFPEIPIEYKVNWGMADAALIAEHARREVKP